jgi:hypothetical protein
LINNVAYTYSKYMLYAETLEATLVAEREADPAAAAAAEAARTRAARDAEKAAQLPADEKVALLQELTVAMASAEPAEAVKALLSREAKAQKKAADAQKLISREKTSTAEAKLTSEAAAKKAQKRYLALKEQVKMEEDKKAAAVLEAQEAAQALIDAKKAVKLTPAESLAITKEVQAVLKCTTEPGAKNYALVKKACDAVLPESDYETKPAFTAAQKAAGREAAADFQEAERKARNVLRKAKKALEKAKTPATDKGYQQATTDFYTQKARF